MQLKLAEEKSKIHTKYFDVLYASDFNHRLYYYVKTLVLCGSDDVIKKLAIVERNSIIRQ